MIVANAQDGNGLFGDDSHGIDGLTKRGKHGSHPGKLLIRPLLVQHTLAALDLDADDVTRAFSASHLAVSGPQREW
ncbi:hypothetical protein PpBr36_00384 [Pyricularia pennisetigena]|uniref:hypothetical protein n=1 Tax=Pyricularia pennisetigena TaxID=1578925 RepID=UPI0011500919|nr:hypothetical protein PpBr36_00384 [Pyricularia pennisetigena]TLS28556.1 hypothetical protein PpBr36_00384 [Pyricularia pennisetigena]